MSNEKKTLFKKYPHLILGLVLVSICMVCFFILSSLGWPGKEHFCINDNHCYCETFNYETVAVQPVNTWTNMLAVFVGLFIIWKVENGIKKKSLDANNPMKIVSFYSILYGNLVWFIGIGSAFFHGSMTDYGGLADNISMNLYISFLILYNITQLLRLNIKTFLSIFIPLNIILGWLSIYPHLGRVMFIYLVLIEVTIEILIQILSWKKKTWFNRKLILMVTSMLAFGLGCLAWGISKTGAILCFPDSIYQGHGLWHIFYAWATYIIFRYLGSQKAIKIDNINEENITKKES